MAKLARAVFVRDPAKHQDILLRAGETPAPQYAVLVKNPACWEGGKLPTAVKKHLADTGEGTDESAADPDSSSGDSSGDSGAADTRSEDDTPAEGDDSDDTKPAARKTAAKKPARGRTAAAEGAGGQ